MGPTRKLNIEFPGISSIFTFNPSRRRHIAQLCYSVFFVLLLLSFISLVTASPSPNNRLHAASGNTRSDHPHHDFADDDHDPAFSNFAGAGASNPITRKRAEEDNTAVTDGDTCEGFEGDQDTYGLGIRIGLYFQWVTSSIAYNLVPSEAVTMRGVNNCFQAAMFAGLLFVTITKGSNLQAIEAYLMLLFCMGGVCSGTIAQNDRAMQEQEQDNQLEGDENLNNPNANSSSFGHNINMTSTTTDPSNPNNSTTPRPPILRHRTHPSGPVKQFKSFALTEATTLGGYFRLLLGCGFIAYGLWFAFTGMDRMLAAQPKSCKYAFFFVRVELSGWFRTLLKVVFVCAAIPACLQLIFESLFLLGEVWKFLFMGGWRGNVPATWPVDIDVNRGPGLTRQLSANSQTRNTAGGATTTTNTTTNTTTTTAAAATTTTSTATATATATATGTATAGTGTTTTNQQDRYIVIHGVGLQNIRLRKGNVGFSGALILFIIAVELTIKWNKIEGVADVGSTGQLLPVIIGVGGVGRVLMRFVSDILEEVAIDRLNRKMMLGGSGYQVSRGDPGHGGSKGMGGGGGFGSSSGPRDASFSLGFGLNPAGGTISAGIGGLGAFGRGTLKSSGMNGNNGMDRGMTTGTPPQHELHNLKGGSTMHAQADINVINLSGSRSSSTTTSPSLGIHVGTGNGNGNAQNQSWAHDIHNMPMMVDPNVRSK